jgi:uncharacterized protein (TIGR02246 family)
MRVWRSAVMAAIVLMVCATGAVRAQSGDEAAVRAVAAQETAAWGKFDPKAIASLYTEDAIWQNPFGVRLHGSAQLEQFLTRLFARPGYRSAKETDEAKITDVRFPSPTVAVVWSEESSQGQIDDDTGKPMAPRHSHYLEVVVKKAGVWKISECIIMDEIQHP